MVVPWFPSLRAKTVESQQGMFEYRQSMALVSRGNEFRIISLKWHGQSKSENIGENIRIIRTPILLTFPQIRYPVPNLITLTREIKKVCLEWQPDILIYGHLIYLTTLPILWLKNKLDVPTIVTTDVFPGISWFYGNKLVDGIGYLYSMTIGKTLLKQADKIQFLSSQLTEYVNRLSIERDKAFVVTRGVDTELFKPRDNQGHLRVELGIAENDAVILYVGRLDLVKGVTYLLQAVERILSKHSKVTFLIVGDGSLREKYEDFARPYSANIIFTGWRNDVPQLMNIADIFVLPSLSEGAANVAMEASASGLPVIATEVGEVPNIIADGETGILLKPKDVDGLTEALETLIADPSLARNMGKAGRTRMEEKYGWERICQSLEKEYQEVIESFNRAG